MFCLCPRPGSEYSACPSNFFLCSPVGRVIKAGLAEPDPFFILGEYFKVRFQKGLVLSASLLYLAGIKDVSLVLSPGRLSNCPQLSIAVYIVE